MVEKDQIEIIEKPDYIDWDEIHNCLWEAHAVNRCKGVVMKFPSLSGEEIRRRIESGNGKMYVALVNGNVAAVAGYQIKHGRFWFGETDYLYLCFAGVRSEFSGKGLYKSLYIYRERERERLHLPMTVFDTHERNKHMIDINKHHGFVEIDYKKYGSHNNIVMARWANGCPCSTIKCKLHYSYRKLRIRVKSLMHSKILS